jgi:hypothetical protein
LIFLHHITSYHTRVDENDDVIDDISIVITGSKVVVTDLLVVVVVM